MIGTLVQAVINLGGSELNRKPLRLPTAYLHYAIVTFHIAL